MGRLAELLAAIAAHLEAAGIPARVVTSAADAQILAQRIMPRYPGGAALVACSGWTCEGGDEGAMTVEAALALYLAAVEGAGDVSTTLDLVERLAGLIHGQLWGLPDAWIGPAGAPQAVNQFAAPRDAEGPGGAAIWALGWTQTVELPGVSIPVPPS